MSTVQNTATAAKRPAVVSGELGPVDDILVFVRSSDRFRVVGGVGRGAGWAEIVEIDAGDEPLVERAWRSGVPVRVSGSEPGRIAGPYWARHAVVVPVGQEHLVIFGSATSIDAGDAIVVRAAAQAVADTHGVPAEKLLADELELVQAIRSLMAYRAETVEGTARHIAEVAARALSCEVGAITVRSGTGLTFAFRVGAPVGSGCPRADGPDTQRYLDAALALPGALVEQEASGSPQVWDETIVSRMTLPIGGHPRLAALALGHAATRPRGFTMLCQRIGRAIAESAELLLSQAIAREQIAAERDLMRRASVTDPLTGVGNRAAWDVGLADAVASDEPFAVLSFDLDALKAINDRYGHASGDAVIRGAANALRSSLRDDDLLARVGGDEFLVLLRHASATVARRVLSRASRNLAAWRVSEFAIAPLASAGWAVSGDDPASTVTRADEKLYAAKRRRGRARPPTDRRQTDEPSASAARTA